MTFPLPASGGEGWGGVASAAAGIASKRSSLRLRRPHPDPPHCVGWGNYRGFVFDFDTGSGREIACGVA